MDQKDKDPVLGTSPDGVKWSNLAPRDILFTPQKVRIRPQTPDTSQKALLEGEEQLSLCFL